MTSYIFRDGEMIEVPDTVITEDAELHTPISNTLIVRNGATVTTYAPVNGTVSVEAGATLIARSSVTGTVNVNAGGMATFHRNASGTLQVGRTGLAHLLPTASALGTMHIEGKLINEGVRGVNVSGGGVVEDRTGSRVRQPDRTLPDGTVIYEN